MKDSKEGGPVLSIMLVLAVVYSSKCWG